MLSLFRNLPLKFRIFLALAGILLAAISVYANSIGGKFIWDDEYLIVRNVLTKDPARFGELFTTDPGAGAGKVYGYYRPLFILSYALDHALWGLNPIGYHVLNLALHLGVAVLLFLLIHLLFGDWFLAWLATLFYVAHPVHVEAVSYISGRVDPLVTFWMLLALLCYIKRSRGNPNKPLFILMLFSFACALFSKENSLILPGLIVVYHAAFCVKLRRGDFLSLLAVLVLYFIFRTSVFESIGVGSRLLPGLLDRIPGFFAAILNYFRLLVAPGNLHMEYGLPRFAWYDPQVLGGMVLTVLLTGLAFWQRKKRPVVFFSIAWFYVALLPASNLYPLGFFMTERYLYLPSIGFFILLAWVIQAGLRDSRIRLWVILGSASLFLFYAASTIAQNRQWQDAFSFYSSNLKFAPDSVRMNNEMGRLYDSLGQKEKALEYYQKVVALDPGYSYAYNNIGVILLQGGKPEEAIPWFQKALARAGNYPDAWNNLGNANLGLGRPGDAVEAYEKAIRLLPNFAGYYNNLGNAYKALGEMQKAVAAYHRGIQLDPRDAVTHYNLGIIHLEQNNLTEAEKSFERAISLRGDLGVAYLRLALIHRVQGAIEKARREAQQAQERGVRLPPELFELLK